MRRLIPSLLAAVLALPAAARAAEVEAAAPAEAQKSKAEDAMERIAPVSGNLFLKTRRFEVSPTLGLSLGDAFFQKYGLGLKLDYHLNENLSFGLHGAYVLNTPSGAVSVCNQTGCRAPEMADLTEVPGRVGLLAGLDLLFTPFYGKVNVFSEKVLHFDTSVIAGVSLLQYGAPGGTDTFGLAGHIGLGQRYLISRSVTLRAELRDYIYSAQTVTLGDSNSKIEHQLMFELGVSFFLGEPPQQ